jgi:DNA-binding CsgD family transcriptional regulator
VSLIAAWLCATDKQLRDERLKAQRSKATRLIASLSGIDTIVLKLLCRGHSCEVCANVLLLTRNQVVCSVVRIKRRLGVSSIAEAAVIAARANLV